MSEGYDDVEPTPEPDRPPADDKPEDRPVYEIPFDSFAQMMEQVVIPVHRRSPGSEYLDPLDRPNDPVFLAFFRHVGRLWTVTRDSAFESAWLAYCECIKPHGHDPFVPRSINGVEGLGLRADLEVRQPGPSDALHIFEALEAEG